MQKKIYKITFKMYRGHPFQFEPMKIKRNDILECMLFCFPSTICCFVAAETFALSAMAYHQTCFDESENFKSFYFSAHIQSIVTPFRDRRV